MRPGAPRARRRRPRPGLVEVLPREAEDVVAKGDQLSIADRTIDVPCLMISAADDPVLTTAMTLGMEERVPNLERIVIENCGHWTQQERPEETSAAMLAYLRRLDAW